MNLKRCIGEHGRWRRVEQTLQWERKYFFIRVNCERKSLSFPSSQINLSFTFVNKRKKERTFYLDRFCGKTSKNRPLHFEIGFLWAWEFILSLNDALLCALSILACFSVKGSYERVIFGRVLDLPPFYCLSPFKSK